MNAMQDENGTVFSPCGRYRYRLQRGDSPRLAFVMLNPSTADARKDDPTIRRCVSFAKREGFGGIVVCNVYAWRATDPRALLHVANPFGQNVQHLQALASAHSHIVVAWGDKVIPAHGLHVCEVLESRAVKLSCFGVTKKGNPRHPLYVPSSTELRPFDALNPWAST